MKLTKKEIQTVNTAMLNSRYCELVEKGERLPAHEFPIAEAREVIWIEDELRRRVIRAVGHDFYPPDHVETKPTIKSVIAPKTEIKKGVKIKFRAVVSSSMGTKAADFTVEAGSKAEADILVQKETRKLGLQGATWKIK